MRFPTAHRLDPQVLGAALIGDVVQGGAVRAPHRPLLLGVALEQLLIGRSACPLADEPDLALIEMAVAFPPPLTLSEAARDERERRAVGRWGGHELRRVPIGR